MDRVLGVAKVALEQYIWVQLRVVMFKRTNKLYEHLVYVVIEAPLRLLLRATLPNKGETKSEDNILSMLDFAASDSSIDTEISEQPLVVLILESMKVFSMLRVRDLPNRRGR